MPTTPIMPRVAEISAASPKGKVGLIAAVTALALGLSWRFRFVLDDAFISFHYARSWAEGTGLTWFGEHVEGYTNFGWVAWLAAGFSAGVDPIPWAYAGGLASLACAIGLTGLIAVRMTDDRERQLLLAAVATLALATNYSFLAFGTSGLGTMAQTALVLAAFACAQRAWACACETARGTFFAPLAGASLCAALALYVRLDSAVLLVPIGMWTAAAAWRSPRRRLAHFGALALPVLLLVAPWFLWKLDFYGRLLPNSFYAKVRTDEFSPDGALQWARFTLWYGLAPAIAVTGFAAHWWKERPASASNVAVLVAVIALHGIYLVYVGGDFMEFRFMVPAAPYFALCAASMVEACTRAMPQRLRHGFAASCVLFLASCSALHARTYVSDPNLRMDGIAQLGTFYGLYPDGNWDRIGKALAREFGDADVVIATTAAGAVPYYSRLTTIDLFGLNDRRIPELGVRSAYRRPGHHSQASFAYLRERGVNLILAMPVVVTTQQLAQSNAANQLRTWAQRAVPPQSGAPSELVVLAMPLDAEGDSDLRLLLWYFGPTAELDRITEAWRRSEVSWHADDAVPPPPD